MEISKIILEFLKIVISWPVVVGIVFFIGVRNFKVEIAALISRINNINWGGNSVNFNPKSDQESKTNLSNDNLIPNQSHMSSEMVKSNPEYYITAYNNLKKYHDFEFFYNNIFRTQLYFLQQLNKFPNVGMPHSTAVNYFYQYRNSLSLMQQIYAKEDDYFAWLINCKLVKKEPDETYLITELGTEFLQYTINGNYDYSIKFG